MAPGGHEAVPEGMKTVGGEVEKILGMIGVSRSELPSHGKIRDGWGWDGCGQIDN